METYYTNPRLAAFQALKEIEEKTTLEQALLNNTKHLNSQDLALCTAIVYECVRHQSYLDFVITNYLTEKKAPQNLSIVLRLGLAQLIYFDRLKEHALVMETVEIAKKMTPGRHKVVNAILRALLRVKNNTPNLWPPQAPTNKPEIKYSHPKWLVEKWTKQLGSQETEKLLIKNNEYTPPTVRVNSQKISRADLQDVFNFKTEKTPFSPYGLKLETFNKNPEHWPGYEEGYFTLQDEASQLLALLVEEKENFKILDACAGLGGKTVSLATLFPKAEIVALDKDSNKLNLLQIEAKRLNCEKNIICLTSDFFKNNLNKNFYDLVLLDAPCSGLGVIRRRPDLKWAKTPEDLIRLSSLQLQMLNKAGQHLKVNGQLIYSVCSVSPEEGPLVIDNFLKQNTNFKKQNKADYKTEIQSLVNENNCIALWPHLHNTDGFFWAVLSKKE